MRSLGYMRLYKKTDEELLKMYHNRFNEHPTDRFELLEEIARRYVTTLVQKDNK